MYPPETSLIPASVSLFRYVIENGFWQSFTANYPYWYLGSTPFKYLIGPILPSIVLFLNRITYIDSLFNISIYLIIFSMVISAIGWSLFVSTFSSSKKIAFVFFLVYLMLPAKYILAFGLSDLSYTFSRMFLPFIFLYFSKNKNVISIILIILALLTNTTIITPIIVGIVSLTLILKKKPINLLLNIIFPFAVVNLWYGYNYWLNMLFNPSIGGLTPLRVLTKIVEFSRNILPIVLAFWFIKFGRKEKNNLESFALIISLVFVVFTIYRFLADWDFWIDWSTYLIDIEIGLALLSSIKLVKLNISKYITMYFLLFLCLSYYIYFKIPGYLVSKDPPQVAQVIQKLSDVPNIYTSTLFLSGSSVFWLNSYQDIVQVRGGRDSFSSNRNWFSDAYVIRESKDSDKIVKAVDNLKVDYVLVHTDKSLEFFKDFKNVNIWQSLAKKVFELNGDILYAF